MTSIPNTLQRAIKVATQRVTDELDKPDQTEKNEAAQDQNIQAKPLAAIANGKIPKPSSANRLVHRPAG